MKKPRDGIIIFALVLICIGLGWKVLGNSRNGSGVEQKPVLQQEAATANINDDTLIVFEQEFSQCGHVVISSFAGRDSIIGKSLEEVKSMLTADGGYQISFQDNTLLITQVVNGWCQVDQNKQRLKEYQGKIAVYKGPGAEQEILVRVTGISMSRLPEEIQTAIQAGEYEFDSEQALNDALENFDEYQ